MSSPNATGSIEFGATISRKNATNWSTSSIFCSFMQIGGVRWSVRLGTFVLLTFTVSVALFNSFSKSIPVRTNKCQRKMSWPIEVLSRHRWLERIISRTQYGPAEISYMYAALNFCGVFLLWTPFQIHSLLILPKAWSLSMMKRWNSIQSFQNNGPSVDVVNAAGYRTEINLLSIVPIN